MTCKNVWITGVNMCDIRPNKCFSCKANCHFKLVYVLSDIKHKYKTKYIIHNKQQDANLVVLCLLTTTSMLFGCRLPPLSGAL